MPTINELARNVYSAAVELRTVCEEYSSKRYGGRDVKALFPEKTDADVETALRSLIKPKLEALRTARQALVAEIKASVDATVT